MAQMQIRRGRVEAGLDPQWTAKLQTRIKIGELDDFFSATANQLERSCDIVHVNLDKTEIRAGPSAVNKR